MKAYQEELLRLYNGSSKAQDVKISEVVQKLKYAIEDKAKSGRYQFELPLNTEWRENRLTVDALSRLVFCTWFTDGSIHVDIKREPQGD